MAESVPDAERSGNLPFTRARLRRWRWRAAWWCLLALCLGVRSYHLEQAPAHNECGDEYTWTWSGMTLLQNGKPKGWSGLRAYKAIKKPTHWRGYGYPMVEPWLDHPPLYAVYMGSWMLAWGERQIFDVDLHQMRLSSLPLAALSFILLSAVLRRHTTRGAVLLALLFYSVVPAIVLHQRLIVSENLFVPITLGILLLLSHQQHSFVWWRWFAIACLTALLPMTKVAALSSCVFLVIWALITHRSRERLWTGAAIVAGTGIGIAAYWLYGHYLDTALFSEVLANHRARFKGFGGLFALLMQPRLVNTEVKDLLTTVSAALALASLAQRRLPPWGLAVLVYPACMAFFVDQSHVYGWYFIPLYPWLCAALATAIARASRQRMLGLSLLWCTVASVVIASSLLQYHWLTADTLRYAYLALLLTIYGTWTAFPRLAHATLPTVNGVFVAGVAAVCLFDVYSR